MKAGRGKGAGRAVRLLVTGAAGALLASRVDAPALGSALANAHFIPLCAAFLVYVAGQALSALRWWLIAASVNFRKPPILLIRYYVIAMFFNLFGPSTLGGDVVRALYLAGSEPRRVTALHTVLFDRLSGLVMLIAVVVAAMLVFGRFGLPTPLFFLVAAGGGMIIVGWWTLPLLSRHVLSVDNRFRRLIEVEVGPFWNDKRLLAAVALISVLMHLWQVCAVYLVTLSVGGGIPWQYCFVFHPLVSILAAFPVSLAGLGVREIGYVYFLSVIGGVPDATAVAFSLLWLGVLLGSALLGGVVFLLDGGALPQLRRSQDERTYGD